MSDSKKEHKIKKYAYRLNKAISNKNHQDSIKYYEHFKYHVLKGGAYDEKKQYYFKILHDYLFNEKKFNELDKKELSELLGKINEYIEGEKELKGLLKFSEEKIKRIDKHVVEELNKIITPGCEVDAKQNSGLIKDQPGYSMQCFWISIIDYLEAQEPRIKMKLTIKLMRERAGIDEDTKHNEDTDFSKLIYLKAADMVAKEFDLTIAIYEIDMGDEIKSQISDDDLLIRIHGNGSNIVILRSRNNAHFEWVKGIKCPGKSEFTDLTGLKVDNIDNYIESARKYTKSSVKPEEPEEPVGPEETVTIPPPAPVEILEESVSIPPPPPPAPVKTEEQVSVEMSDVTSHVPPKLLQQIIDKDNQIILKKVDSEKVKKEKEENKPLTSLQAVLAAAAAKIREKVSDDDDDEFDKKYTRTKKLKSSSSKKNKSRSGKR
jgi:hypothetical protein